MPHAFITGGSGFIGTNLIKLLCEKNWQITALQHTHANKPALGNLPIRWVGGTITNKSSLAKAIPDDTDVVFHLAGDTNLWAKQNPRQTAVNVRGTENMIAAAGEQKVPVFIHTSSVAAWGSISGTITEKNKQHGYKSWINYERTKWAAERKALKGLDRGMRVVILNPANVIGAHDRSNWARLFIALSNNNLPFIAEGCISVTHVKDVARAYLSAVENGKAGERYILGGSHRHFSDFIACAQQALATRNRPAIIPVSLFRSYARFSSAVCSLFNCKPSITPELAHIMTRKKVRYISEKAVCELNYHISPMQEPVRDCLQWLRSKGLV